MFFRRYLFGTVGLVTLGVFATIACQTTETPSPAATPLANTPTPEPTPNPFLDVPGIVDPTNTGWPRVVEGLNGQVTVPSKPQRIITASVGHDEMTLALVPVERLVGVGGASKNITYSNVASAVQDIPEISRDPETLIALDPDIIVTSPFFPVEGIEALTRLGVPVVQTELSNDPEGRIQNILFLGYIYGEEERALRVAEEVDARYKAIRALAHAQSANRQPRVLALTRYSDKIWTAGIDSTEGGIIDATGALNVASDAGINGNATTSLEGVISMTPEVIFITQPLEFGAEEFRQDLLNDPALAELPAIKEERIYIVDGKFFTTLSFWNIHGVEELATILWPEAFEDVTFPPFSSPREG